MGLATTQTVRRYVMRVGSFLAGVSPHTLPGFAPLMFVVVGFFESDFMSDDNQKHTPEPWKADGLTESPSETGVAIVAVNEHDFPTRGIVAWCHGNHGAAYGNPQIAIENARRIVACVNALQGVPTEDLDRAVMLGIFSSVSKLQHLNDELQLKYQTACNFIDLHNEVIKQLQVGIVPDGWKLVPVEPTNLMLDEGAIVFDSPSRHDLTTAWANMLDAAPAFLKRQAG